MKRFYYTYSMGDYSIDISAMLLLINNALLFIVGWLLKSWLSEQEQIKKDFRSLQKDTAVNEKELQTNVKHIQDTVSEIKKKLDSK